MSTPRPAPVVVGTAGHIDHGKSALIQALTGDHPDRWDEEKKRGITIDLGYAQMDFDDGLEIGFVDVPGHEKLVRKMVAGASGMGAAMLVIACDDGVMPQTREHFQVLQILGVKRGMVVLTKTDLVDEDTCLLARADAEELIEDSPWQDFEIYEVSAHQGTGLPELKEALRKLALEVQEAPVSNQAFRLPIQRSFALHGAGTVATGVCESGSLSEGETVEIFPGEKKSRVRRVQVHGRAAESARPGLRTALNLPEFEAEDCPRGVVLAAPGSMESGRLLRITITPLPSAPSIDHGAAIQCLAGTAAINGRIWLPPAGLPGSFDESAPWLADLELDEKVAVVPGQRLVLRRPSPAINLAAGRFLGFGHKRLRRKDHYVREQLLELAAVLDNEEQLMLKMLEVMATTVSAAELAGKLGWTVAATIKLLDRTSAQGAVRQLGDDKWAGAGRIGALGKDVAAAIVSWRRKCPHRVRIPLTELRDRLGKKKSKSLVELSDEDLEQVGLKKLAGTDWQLLHAEIDPVFEQLAQSVLSLYQKGGLAPLKEVEMAEQLGIDEYQLKEAMDYLQDCELLVRISGGLLFARSVVEELRDMVVSQLQGTGMDIPHLRDHFNTSRKFMMPLLEHLDAKGITERRGPNRLLRNPKAPL